MEHIVQFGISVDDTYIKNKIEEHGYEDVIKAIINKAYSEMNQRINFNEQNLMKEFLDKNKETIIERAVNNITASIKSSKKYKEALSQVAEELFVK